MNRESLQAGLTASDVPAGLHEGLIRYVLDGYPTGGFLAAVLENDLYGACNRADLNNRPFIYHIVYFLHNYAPVDCWRSPAKVKAWGQGQGLNGVYRRANNEATPSGRV